MEDWAKWDVCEQQTMHMLLALWMWEYVVSSDYSMYHALFHF